MRETAGRGGPEPSTRVRGRAAEDLVAAWLERRGWRVLARNHATRRGEVDLVCEEGEVLCFVEVRSRVGGGQGAPEETVGRTKARRVVAAATDWAVRHGALDREIRFDVAAVHTGPGGGRIELFRGAFDADGR